MKRIFILLLVVCLSLFIGAAAFGNDSDFVIRDGILISYKGTDENVVIPSGIHTIDYYAFSENENIVSVIIPKGVKEIDEGAFWMCTNLVNVVLPDTLETIGDYVFDECSSLSEISLPDSLLNIGDSAFKNCKNLTEITLPSGLQYLGEFAFYGCSGLSSLMIPKNTKIVTEYVDSEGKAPYGLVPNKTLLQVYTGSPAETWAVAASQRFHRMEDGEYTIVDGVLYSYVGSGGDLIVPAVKKINRYAFAYDESIVTVVLPAGLEEIGAYAFMCAVRLYKINIPEGVTTIGNGALNTTLYMWSLITDIVIPDSVISIGKNILEKHSTTIWANENSVAAGWAKENGYAFQPLGKKNNEYDIIIDSNDERYLMRYRGTDINIVIPSDLVEIIGQGSFSKTKMTKLIQSVTIPEGVHTIDWVAFIQCSKLSNVILPESLKTIKGRAFEGCSSLSSIRIPKGVTTIGIDVFPKETVLRTYEGSYAAEWGIANGYTVKYIDRLPEINQFSILDEENNDLTGTTIELNIAAGEKLTLQAMNPDGSTPTVTWMSSSAKVAEVTGGVVTPKKVGTTKITASYQDGKKTVSATVTVKVVSKVLPGNIIISGPESVAVGKTAKFTAKIGVQKPAPSVKTIVWESSDTSKATVNNKGVVTGKAATTSPIEIRACAKDSLVNGKYTNCVSASLNVVTAAASVTIEVINGTTTLDAGETVTLKAVVSPAGASQEVDWTAKSSKVASVTINTDGTVTVKAQAKGSIDIKATTMDGTKKSDSVKLTVGVKVKDGMLSIKGAAPTLAVKKNLKLTAIFNPVPSNKKVEWSILEGDKLITLKNGTVKAIAPGHAKVQVCSVENPSVCAAAEFDVISPVTSVKFDQKKAQTLDIGGGSAKLTLKATVLPANATKPELEWKSSKESVATVDENGVVTAKGVGSAVITAAATDGSKKSAKLTVKVVSKVQDDSLTIEGNTHELGLKQTTTLQVKFNQENAPTNQKVTWKSSAPKIASVSAKGVVKGLKEGDATITATSADNKTVKATWLIKVSVSGKSDTMLMDEMMQETALPDIEALVDALLAETEDVTVEPTTETVAPTAVEPEEGVVDEPEMVQTPETVEETPEGEENALAVTPEPEESYEEEPVVVEVIESEEEIAVVYESEDADSLMTEESESGLDYGESLIGTEGVDVVIRDLGEYDDLSGETGGVISLTRDRFDLTNDVFSGLVFTVEDESVAKLTDRSADEMLLSGVELQLLNAGETKLIIKQGASGEVLREIRLVVTAAPLPEEPIEEELPSKEVLTESVEVLESGEPTVDEESILVETDAEPVFSIASEE